MGEVVFMLFHTNGDVRSCETFPVIVIFLKILLISVVFKK